MKDITIKGIPEEAEQEVRRMAAVAVERYLRTSLKPTTEQENQVRTDLNTFLKANSMQEVELLSIE